MLLNGFKRMKYVIFFIYKLKFILVCFFFFSVQSYAQTQIQPLSHILANLPKPIYGVKNIPDFMHEIIDNKEKEAPDAFYVIDIHQLVKQQRAWQEALPTIKPYYAVKVNPDPVLLKTLILLNLSFDCASINEIKQVLTLGGKSQHIIFAHPIKSEGAIRQAYKLGVNMMTFDTLAELKKMHRLAPKGIFILRMHVNDLNSTNPLGGKFGANQLMAQSIIDYAVRHKIVISGLSFHVGSNCLDILQYEQALDDAYKLFNFAKTKGMSFHYLDLGGGWPGDNNQAFKKIAHRVNVGLRKFSHIKPLNIIAEPGRFYATSSMSVAVKIIAKKDLSQTTKAYYLADGAYGLFGSSIYYGYDNHLIEQEGWHLRPLLKSGTHKQEKEKPTYSSILFGPTCDAGDKIGSPVQLPELEVGTYLYSDNIGAYTLATLSRFNQITLPEPFYVCQSCQNLN